MRHLSIWMLGLALAVAFVPAQAQDDEYMPDYGQEESDDGSSGDSYDGTQDGGEADPGYEDPGYEDDSSGDAASEVIDAVEEDASAGYVPAPEPVGTVEVGAAEEEESEPQEPWHLYVGASQAVTTMSLSNLPPDTENDFDSGIIRVRAGMQLVPGIDVELQVGQGQSASAPDEVKTDSYYGAFLVPSTSLFDVLDLSVPLGYARSSVGDADFNSMAFGINLELPLRNFSEAIPDIRLTAGWMTYYQKVDARLYGVNFGLRYDFDLGGDPGWEEGW